MPNLSIKDVPEAWAEALRQRAARNHRSLQGELMALVEQAVVARMIGVVRGTNYSNGDATTLMVYAPLNAAPALRVRPGGPEPATAGAAPRP